MTGGPLLNVLLKSHYQRPRPTAFDHLVEAGGFSFPSGHSMGSMLFFGTLAYVVYFTILRRSGATNTLLVTLLNPVTAILLGHFVLGEAVTTQQIAGALIIGSALLVIDGRVFGLLYRRA